ncbi:hypothetical protein LSAT2_024787 [Lamellibrachia satsuma]|nr:hypothetical protein LSAT2_024787 [Lamellibrachia satsuma]
MARRLAHYTLQFCRRYLHNTKLEKMTSTDFSQHFLDVCGKDKLDLKKTFQHQDERCRGTWVRPTCVVRPNVVASKTWSPTPNATGAVSLNGSIRGVAKLPLERSKFGVVKVTSKTSSSPVSQNVDKMVTRKTKRGRKRIVLVRAAGFTAWLVAFPVMALLVAVRTPAVDEEDLYDDPLLPWNYGRKPKPNVVR